MAKKSKHLQVQGRYIYNPEIRDCPDCGQRLRARPYYEWRKRVQQLSGTVWVISQARVCDNPKCDHQGAVYKSAAAQMVTLPKCTYGLDVIAQIGWWRDRDHLNRAQIHERLRDYGIELCERQVDHLYARYQVLVGCAERLEVERLSQVTQERGGLIIGLDGLAPEGAAEQLWVVREVQTELILAVAWLAPVNHHTLAALLKPVVGLGFPILATLSDKQGCVKKALAEVLPQKPHQWCQSHYLGNAMRPIYEQDSALKTELRHRIRQELRESLGQVLSAEAEQDFSPSARDRDGGG